MKSFFANVWTKRVVAILSLVYTFFVLKFSYFSIFYDMHIHQRGMLCLAISGVSLAALIVMLYTRKQIFTRISSFIILPAMLPVVLLYFGEWGAILPIIITGIIILLLSGAGEGLKTAIATIILLMYIFGALGYFLFTSFFVTPTKEQVIDTGVSPSGEYRYRVVNTEDSSNGSTAVYVEPNTADIKYKMVSFTLKNLERVVYLDRPSDDEVTIEWTTQSRKEITDYLNSISDQVELSITDEELEHIGYTYDNKLMLTTLSASRKFKLGLTASDVDPVPLDSLNEEQLDFFGIGKDADGRYYIKDISDRMREVLGEKANKRVYFKDLTDKEWKVYNSDHVDAPTGITLFNVKKYHNIRLNTLTDEQLAYLGVSDSGDVMILSALRHDKPTEEGAEPGEDKIVADKKVVFRYYVAEIDDYFDVNSRHFSFDLLQ